MRMRQAIVATALSIGAVGVISMPVQPVSATHQVGSNLCTGTGWSSNNTAYSDIASQQTTACRHRAAARCGSAGWTAHPTWRPQGTVSSWSCNQFGTDIQANGWYITLAH